MSHSIRHIPRGIHSVREHEPLQVFDEAGTVTEEQFDKIVFKVREYASMPVDKNGRIADIVHQDLRDQIEACIKNNLDHLDELPERILAIPRIAQALKLMDDVDAGVVELITYGSKPESSDAR